MQELVSKRIWTRSGEAGNDNFERSRLLTRASVSRAPRKVASADVADRTRRKAISLRNSDGRRDSASTTSACDHNKIVCTATSGGHACASDHMPSNHERPRFQMHTSVYESIAQTRQGKNFSNSSNHTHARKRHKNLTSSIPLLA